MKNTQYFIPKLSSVILSVSLVIIMIAMTCTGIAFAKVMANPDKVSYYLRGDVNMDGEVHAADARLALRGSIKLEDYAPGSPEFLRADFNGDGDLTAGDARAILRVSIGLTPDHGQIFNPELDDYYKLHPDDPDKPTEPTNPTDPTNPSDPYEKIGEIIDKNRVGMYYYGENAHVLYLADDATPPAGAIKLAFYSDDSKNPPSGTMYYFPDQYHRVNLEDIPADSEYLYYKNNGRLTRGVKIVEDDPTNPSYGEPTNPYLLEHETYGPDDPYYYPGDMIDPARAGMYYYGQGDFSHRVSYEDIMQYAPEGARYIYYDENGNKEVAYKPYSPGNEPTTLDTSHCPYCGKSTDDDVVNHKPACTIGGCARWIIDMTCPYCNTFVPANTCHTCGS